MFKPKSLLKVVSILLIIFGALGLLISVLGVFGASFINNTTDPAITQNMKDAITDAYTPLTIALSLGGGIFCILSGIFGLIGKSFKAALIVMVLYIVIEIVNIAMAIPVSGFSIINLITFILPILYLWGLYQSKE
ncbi:MAG TPA: hypothetical protein IAC62_05225 [Candidatus Pelethocola excrementipullorum]|nr:hypothetical protein [Candidatus Pelethocola excrementipullorum]